MSQAVGTHFLASGKSTSFSQGTSTSIHMQLLKNGRFNGLIDHEPITFGWFLIALTQKAQRPKCSTFFGVGIAFGWMSSLASGTWPKQHWKTPTWGYHRGYSHGFQSINSMKAIIFSCTRQGRLIIPMDNQLSISIHICNY